MDNREWSALGAGGTEAEPRKRRVAIIGAGASGLAAAIAAARAGAQADVYEQGKTVGSVILKTGNGRCNFTNESIRTDAYNNPDFVAPLLASFGYQEAIDYFSKLGLLARVDFDGRVYPITNAASSVLDVLRLEAEHLGVKEHTGSEICDLRRSDEGFTVYSRESGASHCDAVIVATGGGTTLLKLLGHQMVKSRPGLCAIHCAPGPVKGLSGQRIHAQVKLLRDGQEIDVETGELQFREFGISGVMSFDLSRYAQVGDEASIDFFPSISCEDLAAILSKRVTDMSWRDGSTFFTGMLTRILSEAILRQAAVELELAPGSFANMPAKDLPTGHLAALMKDFRLRIEGFDSATAQVTIGGADVRSFDPATLESTLVPGLFACGEVLDIDGRCGGYNLHWAWASGNAAGTYAAKEACAR